MSEDIRLPKELRSMLKDTLGPVVSGVLPEEYLEHRPLITVGDFVTNVLCEQGILPDLSVVDGKTHRGEYMGKLPDVERIYVKNPPEMITVEAWNAVELGISSEKPHVIVVDGEEDLLSLVAIIHCPVGGIVLYGIPSEGMVINIVDEHKQQRSWQVINRMEKVNQGG